MTDYERHENGDYHCIMINGNAHKCRKIEKGDKLSIGDVFGLFAIERREICRIVKISDDGTRFWYLQDYHTDIKKAKFGTVGEPIDDECFPFLLVRFGRDSIHTPSSQLQGLKTIKKSYVMMDNGDYDIIVVCDIPYKHRRLLNDDVMSVGDRIMLHRATEYPVYDIRSVSEDGKSFMYSYFYDNSGTKLESGNVSDENGECGRFSLLVSLGTDHI